MSALVAIIMPYSQSIAASMFLVRLTGSSQPTRVISSGAIGLNPEVETLVHFVAAAGVGPFCIGPFNSC